MTAMEAVHFSGFDDGLDWLRDGGESRHRPPLRVSSFGEKKAENQIITQFSSEWRVHNRTFLSRVYPKGDRIYSTNIPVPLVCRLWEAGVQMVALNLQTVDDTTMMNRSLFELNGGCGYILKPPYDGLLSPSGLRLTVRVLSAHHLPKGRDDRCEFSSWDHFLPELSCNCSRCTHNAHV